MISLKVFFKSISKSLIKKTYKLEEEFQEKKYSSEQFDHFGYTEKTWEAGVSVGYNFLRWYTVSVSYRYADYQSEYDQDYDEHRVMLSLTATSEIFRW